ncbi:hypothetical protein AYJ08_08115 [Brevibacillus sp. SKDU10]|nr:hypothetical protein AYJ08_08115 [Brevibacillus sp. SKDU10]
MNEKKSAVERESDTKADCVVITKEAIIEALRNFSALYDTATNEQKKQLIRAIIKKIEMEPNREDIKIITFWFDFDDALLLSKTRGTLA